MLIVYLVQGILPLVLIAWLAFFPPQSIASFWVQSIAIGSFLVAVSFVGIWTFPPWWTVYIFGALLMLAVGAGLARRPAWALWPRKAAAWLSLFGFASLGL